MDLLKGVGVSLSQVAREYVEAFKILRRQPLIAEAAKHYAGYLERQRVMHAVKFPAAVDEFLKAIEAQGTFRPIYRGLHKSSFPCGQGVSWIPPENHKLRY